MRTIHEWLNEYGDSHKNETNKLIHWICVPSIVFSILGLLYSIKLPLFIASYQLNVGVVISILVLIYYFCLSKSLAVGMFLYLAACMLIANYIEGNGFVRLWLFSVIVFILAWIGQFYGHKIEGKKPSFLKDIQFLMIGPAWLMSFIYKKIGLAL